MYVVALAPRHQAIMLIASEIVFVSQSQHFYFVFVLSFISPSSSSLSHPFFFFPLFTVPPSPSPLPLHLPPFLVTFLSFSPMYRNKRESFQRQGLGSIWERLYWHSTIFMDSASSSGQRVVSTTLKKRVSFYICGYGGYSALFC